MKKLQSEMEAVVTSTVETRCVLDYDTLTERDIIGYEAEVQYVRKEPEVKFILCSDVDKVFVGEPVMIQYSVGKRSYKHSRVISTSNESNCIGGFYFTDGTPA